MTRFRRALPTAVMLILAACATTTETPRPDPTATAEPTPSATPSPDATEGESAEGSGSSSPSGSGGEFGGFTFDANAEADALFIERFSCQNLDDGYEVDYPAEWNANAEVGGVPQCSWFAPTEYQTGDPGTVPDEVAIEMFVVDGERDYDDAETSDRAEGVVGATQPAHRVRVEDGDGEESYEYVVQLGPTPEDGPNLVARTSSEMGGDFNLNRAVLDRMMATMEFIGGIQ